MSSKRKTRMAREPRQQEPTKDTNSPNQAYVEAVARGALTRKKLAGDEGGSLSADQAARLLCLTKATLLRRWKQHRIIGWADGDEVGFPRWQFRRKNEMLPGIRELLQIFKCDDHWRVMLYFLARRHSLAGKRPLDLLRNGEVDRLLKHALENLEENEW